MSTHAPKERFQNKGRGKSDWVPAVAVNSTLDADFAFNINISHVTAEEIGNVLDIETSSGFGCYFFRHYRLALYCLRLALDLTHSCHHIRPNRLYSRCRLHFVLQNYPLLIRFWEPRVVVRGSAIISQIACNSLLISVFTQEDMAFVYLLRLEASKLRNC